MKKILLVLLAVLLLVAGFAGCGGKAQENYVVLDENFGDELYGIGFRDTDQALAKAVQDALDEMMEDGTATEISEKWFKADLYLQDQDYTEDLTPQEGDTSLTDIQAKGKLVLGLDENFPPMGFRDAESNEIVGFDIDLGKEVAKRMGLELVIQPIDWDSKEMELSSGSIDMIWNGMTITDDRIESMTISKPYISNKQVIIVPESSSIKTKADLADKKVGLQKGSSAYEALTADEATFKTLAEVVQYPDNVTVFTDLKAGRIDAFVVDEVNGRWIIENN
ncbi:MAG: transporter substrate-binding domain-containing protein [Christensenellales bacterium]